MKFIAIAKADGYEIVVTQTFRTAEEQNKLFQQGRSTPGSIVTHAKPGQSLHETRQAFDVAFPGLHPYSDAHPWHLLGVWAKAAGLTWGGDWRHPDRPHLQYTGEVAPTETRPTLRKGQPHGGYLKPLQEQLVALGYLKPAGCRGDFGPALEEAVKAFQAAHGLTVDGIWGKQCWAALDHAAKEGGGKV